MLLTIVYLISILFSVLIAFIARRSLKDRLFELFLPYLFLVFCQEIVAQWLLLPRNISTRVLYNIYIPIATIFFSILYYRNPVNKKVRGIILILLALYLIAAVLIQIYFHSSRTFIIYLLLPSGFVITCCAIFFLLNYFSIDSVNEQKKWSPVVWISIGIVVFYPVVNISYALHNEIRANNIRIWGLMLYQAMPQLMSIFMYSCFAYAFYLCRKNQT